VTDQLGGRPDPRSGVPDISQVDIDALPVWPADPLGEYYIPLQSGAWRLGKLPFSICEGYWSGLQQVYGMDVLLRRNNVWMSLSPMEIESQGIGIEFARGHVVIFGMGMGWAAAMSALKPEVERVTVVELDDDIIDLHRRLDLFARLPGHAGEKVRVIEGDALEWKPDGHVDLLMPDIWLDMVSWERAEETREMQDNVGADGVYFWGQELELARQLVLAGKPIDDAGIRETAARWGLPLVGLDTPDYAAKTFTAAKQWMKGRWLDGTTVPGELRSAADDAWPSAG
jgi:hypothetical protein